MLIKTITAITLGFTLIAALFVHGTYATTQENTSKILAHRNLTIDLGNGIQTGAELTMPVLANRAQDLFMNW